MGTHSSFLRTEIETIYVGASKGFYLCLADGSTLTEFSTASEFFTKELPIGVNGYSRKPITFTGPALFDNTTKTASLPIQAATWAPTGSLQFQTVFLIIGGAATGTTGAIAYVHIEPQVILRQASQEFNFELTIERQIG